MGNDGKCSDQINFRFACLLVIALLFESSYCITCLIFHYSVKVAIPEEDFLVDSEKLNLIKRRCLFPNLKALPDDKFRAYVREKINDMNSYTHDQRSSEVLKYSGRHLFLSCTIGRGLRAPSFAFQDMKRFKEMKKTLSKELPHLHLTPEVFYYYHGLTLVPSQVK